VNSFSLGDEIRVQSVSIPKGTYIAERPAFGTIDAKTGCVIAPPFQDDSGRWLEWIPWSEA
jgi:hypothetical protein